MGVFPRAVLGALLWALTLDGAFDILDGACDIEARFLLFSLSDPGEGMYPESLLSEISTVKVPGKS